MSTAWKQYPLIPISFHRYKKNIPVDLKYTWNSDWTHTFVFTEHSPLSKQIKAVLLPIPMRLDFAACLCDRSYKFIGILTFLYRHIYIYTSLLQKPSDIIYMWHMIWLILCGVSQNETQDHWSNLHQNVSTRKYFYFSLPS